MTQKNLLERRFGSVLGAWCIIRIVVSKIVWKIDFIEIIICGSGHRIRPRSSRHVSILFFFIAINLNCKKMRKSILVKCIFHHFNIYPCSIPKHHLNLPQTEVPGDLMTEQGHNGKLTREQNMVTKLLRPTKTRQKRLINTDLDQQNTCHVDDTYFDDLSTRQKICQIPNNWPYFITT